MTGSVLLLATTISGALLMGFLPALLFQLRAPLGRGLAVPETRMDRLATIYLSSLVPLMLAGGWAADHWGAREVLFAGALFAALALAGLGLRSEGRSLGFIVVLLGAASACLTTTCPRLMPGAFLGQDYQTSSFNLGYIAVGLGALLLPLVANVLCTRFGLRHTMLVLALACLLPALLTVVTPKGDFPASASTGELSLLAEPIVWLAGLVAFLYFPLEGSLGTWASRFFSHLGYNPRQVVWWGAGFWGMFLAARLVAAWWLIPGYEIWVVLLLMLVSAITLGNLAGAYGRAKESTLLVVGALLGPVLPTFLGVVISFPGLAPAPATTIGALYSLGTAGYLLFQPPLAHMARCRSVLATIWTALILALVMSIPTLILALIR